MSNVLLIGSYGRGNIGDDAFLAAALLRFKTDTLYINSADDMLLSAKARQVMRTIHTHSLKGLRSKLVTLLEVEKVYYWGGDVWVKYYGERFPRRPLYKMIVLNAVLRLLGKNVVYMGCGIGALRGYDLWLARLSARMARKIVVREERSRVTLGLPQIIVQPDLTAGIIGPIWKRQLNNGQTLRIGVSLLYHIHNPHSEFPKLVTQVAKAIQSIDHPCIEVVLLPMLRNSTIAHDDVWALAQLHAHLPDDTTIKSPSIESVDQFLATIQSLHLIIGARLHANILATYSGIPAIGISYRPKVRAFFEDNALERYCLDVEDAEELSGLINRVVKNYSAVAADFYASAIYNRRRDDYNSLI